MKKIIYILLSLVAILIISISIKMVNFRHKEQIKGELIPLFQFYTLEDKTFTNDNLLSYKNEDIVIIFYDVTCDHCQYMARQLFQIKDKLKKVTVLMIALDDYEAITNFYFEYKLDKIPNCIMLRDKNYVFSKLFGTGGTPSYFVYKNKKLIKRMSGEINMNDLLYRK